MNKFLVVLLGIFLFQLHIGGGVRAEVEDLSKAQNAIHYYCQQWSEANVEQMYETLSFTLKQKVDKEVFINQKIKEIAQIGVVENCLIEDKLIDTGNKSLWKIRVEYQNDVIGTVTVQNWCEKFGKSWRLSEGGLVSGVMNQNAF